MQVDRVGVELWSGAESMGYELTSDVLSVTVADLGAHLASVVMRGDDNDEIEVSVGYPPGAANGHGSHGASIGRYANRIAGARFTLDGVEYELDANEGAHQLHGGPEGFSAYAWSADAQTVGDIGKVVLRHKSKDGDQGFPGTVRATAVYELVGNTLTVSYAAKTTAPTPLNLTNHTYWNLAGAGDLADHHLMVAASHYVEVDQENIPVAGPPRSVAGTRFDCRQSQSLAQIVEAGGYDHCFVLVEEASPAVILGHGSGRTIEITTDQVGLQVYTGQHLPPGHGGIALETQFLPDTPNRPEFGDCTLRPGETYRSVTTYRFLS